MHILVVPPPGSPPALALWQASPDRQQARVLPHPAVPPCGAAPAASATAAERRVRKKDKRDEAELARKWTTGEVGAALNLSVAERDSLLALVTRAVGGEMGPHGDDVGGSVEGVDAATSETAALLAAATEAAGAAANPVTGSQRRATRKALRLPAARPPQRSRFGLFGGAAAALTAADTTGDSGPPGLIYEWLQAALVAWATPDRAKANPSAGSADVIQGVIWSHDDDRLLSLCSSRAARAAFVRVLQAQALLASGVGSPEYGAVPGVFVHAQALLGPPVVSPQDEDEPLRLLISQYIPAAPFMRLAAACAAVLADCSDDGDVDSAAALFQVAHCYFTEPLRERGTTAAGIAMGGGAWGLRRHALHEELALEPMWRTVGVWDALLSQGLAVSSRHAVHANVAAAVFTSLQALLVPMVAMQVPPAIVRAFVSRACAEHGLSGGDERALAGMLSALHAAAAEEATLRQGAVPRIPTLTTYEPFAAGQSTAGSHATIVAPTATSLALIGAAARAVLSTPAASSGSALAAAANRAPGTPASPPQTATVASLAPIAAAALPSAAAADAPRNPLAAPPDAPPVSPGRTLPADFPAEIAATVSPAASDALPATSAASTIELLPAPAKAPAGSAVESSLVESLPSPPEGAAQAVPGVEASEASDLGREPAAGDEPSHQAVPAAVPHLWHTRSRKDADTLARELVVSRLYAPPPGGAILALLEVRRAVKLERCTCPPPQCNPAPVLGAALAQGGQLSTCCVCRDTRGEEGRDGFGTRAFRCSSHPRRQKDAAQRAAKTRRLGTAHAAECLCPRAKRRAEARYDDRP